MGEGEKMREEGKSIKAVFAGCFALMLILFGWGLSKREVAILRTPAQQAWHTDFCDEVRDTARFYSDVQDKYLLAPLPSLSSEAEILAIAFAQSDAETARLASQRVTQRLVASVLMGKELNRRPEGQAVNDAIIESGEALGTLLVLTLNLRSPEEHFHLDALQNGVDEVFVSMYQKAQRDFTIAMNQFDQEVASYCP